MKINLKQQNQHVCTPGVHHTQFIPITTTTTTTITTIYCNTHICTTTTTK
ncbi:hypothetical protein DOY81_001543 [Sarcophaga bullata]|nr:hypothetical protein DOY81_001543 [Sarcophaga bullata]